MVPQRQPCATVPVPPPLFMILERLVIRIPVRQKKWLQQQSSDVKSVSQVVRDLIEEKIDDACQKTAQ